MAEFFSFKTFAPPGGEQLNVILAT